MTGLDQSGIPALTMSSMTPPLRTERLLIRDWSVDDAEAAYRIYGSSEVARWISMGAVDGVPAMRSVLEAWVGETDKYYDGRRLQVFRCRPSDL